MPGRTSWSSSGKATSTKKLTAPFFGKFNQNLVLFLNPQPPSLYFPKSPTSKGMPLPQQKEKPV